MIAMVGWLQTQTVVIPMGKVGPRNITTRDNKFTHPYTVSAMRRKLEFIPLNVVTVDTNFSSANISS